MIQHSGINEPEKVKAILDDIRNSDRNHVTMEEFRCRLGEYCPGLYEFTAKQLFMAQASLIGYIREGLLDKSTLFEIMVEFDKRRLKE